MDTITFTGQLLLATQNDTCKALSVICDNTCNSCSNCNDVAIVGIICGSVVLVAIIAMIILLCKPQSDINRLVAQSEIDNKKREQEHNLEKDKVNADRKYQIEDRDYKKKHEYQKELLSYCREKYDYSQYITNAEKFIKELNGDK